MFKKNPLISTLVIQMFCAVVLIYIIFSFKKPVAWASPLGAVTATPAPFLGPIYYGSQYVYNVIDHDLPCAIVCDDGEDNDWVLHYDGVRHNPVTVTPEASPLPGVTPTLAPTYYPDNYGYDEHAGVDYGLKYVPVLAAADGKVTVANWHHSSNHHLGFGLHVQLLHEGHDSYSTLYAHLSVVTVQLDEIVIADPLNRNGIVGISGNTGAVFGCGSSGVEEDPLCGAHLHFETRKGTDYHPMNPYGYFSTTVPDPWPSETQGAVSYPLWATPPAISGISGTPQYPVGPTVSAPPAPVGVRTIDNEDPEFKLEGSDEFCPNGFNPGGWNGSYYVMPILTDTVPECTATWNITPNALTEPDYYDVYVYIPVLPGIPPLSLSRGVYYEIKGSSMHTAVVVQAAYPNQSHADNWVYIGRYYFTMAGDNEYIKIHNSTFEDDGEGFLVAADAVQLARVNPGQPITPTATPLPPTATPTPTTTTTPAMIQVSVNWGTDDAGQNAVSYPDCATVAMAAPEIYLGRCPNGAAIISGFRFASVPIPHGAIITQARIEFTVDNEFTGTPDIDVIDVIFQGELSANSVTFDPEDPPSARSPLTNSVPWYVGANTPWNVREVHYTPDLTTIVQEIVNLPDWGSGDPITVIVRPRSGWSGSDHRRVFAWERANPLPRHPATLQVWYTLPTPTPTPTATPPILDTGFMSPNASVAGAGGDGNGYETQTSHAYSDNGLFAGDKKSGAGSYVGDPCVSLTTDKHIFRDYQLSIPTNATVLGIEVRLDAYASPVLNSPQICVQLSWNGGVTWTSGKLTPVLTNGEVSYILGNPTDLWGRSWLPTEFSNSNFRVRVIDFANSTSTDFYLDWVAVKVYYQ